MVSFKISFGSNSSATCLIFPIFKLIRSLSSKNYRHLSKMDSSEFILLVPCLLHIILHCCHSGVVPNLTWPIRYLENVGNLFDQISCSTIFVLSFNTHYSHDLTDIRMSNKVVLVQRIFFPKSNRSLFKFFTTQKLFRIKLPLEISETDRILQDPNIDNIRISVNSIKFPRMKCLHAVALTTGHTINTKLSNTKYLFLTFYYTQKILIRVAEDFKHVFQATFLELSASSTNLTKIAKEYQVYVEFKNVLMDSGFLLCPQITNGQYKFLLRISQCLYSLFCWECLPKPGIVVSFPNQNVVSNRVLEEKFYNTFIRNSVEYPVVEIESPRLHVSVNRPLKSNGIGDKNPILIASVGTTDFSILIVELICSAFGKNRTILREFSQKRPHIEVDMRLAYAFTRSAGARTINVVTGKRSYNFVTCFHKQSISFSFFFQPFQFGLWTGIVSSILCLFCFASSLLFSIKRKSNSKFSVLMYMWQTLLEIGPTIPKPVLKNQCVRCLMASWLYLALHITNGYKGILTTGSVAPLRQTTSLKSFLDFNCSFEELPSECPKMYGNLDSQVLDAWIKQKSIRDTVQLRSFCKQTKIMPCFNDILSDILSVKSKKGDTLLGVLVNAATPIFNRFAQIISKHTSRLPEKRQQYNIDNYSERVLNMLYNKMYYWVPRKIGLNQNRFTFSASLEAELLQCSKKTVLFLESDQINKEIEYLSKNYPNKPFFKGENELLYTLTTWKFTYARNMILPETLVGFIQAGIYQKLRETYLQQYRGSGRFQFTKTNIEYGRFATPLSLASNISCVFIVCGGALVLTAFVFLAELLIIVTKNQKTIWIDVFKGFQICLRFTKYAFAGLFVKLAQKLMVYS